MSTAHLAQAVGDREHIDRLGLVVEREHRLVDRAVALAVEVLGAQSLFDHERVQRPIGQQDRAQALLQPIVEAFVEGLDTADLKSAEHLLTTLR